MYSLIYDIYMYAVVEKYVQSMVVQFSRILYFSVDEPTNNQSGWELKK